MLTAIYARVSSEKQEQDKTIDSQIAELRKAAVDRGLTVFQEYIDDGYSGEMMNRPALDRLRDDAVDKRFQHVLIHDPDRLARKTIYAGLIMEELRRYSIKVEFLTMLENNETDEGRLFFGIKSQFAEYEKAKFMERSRRGKLHRAAKGELMISWAPFGYIYIPKSQTQNGYLVINEREAEAVRLIFSLCIDRMLSATKIMQELTVRNIPPPGRNGGTVWHRSVIVRILHNETYAGVWHYNKRHGTEPKYRRGVKPMKAARRLRTSNTKNPKSQWVKLPGSVPLIIDHETYDRAQEQMVQNRSFAKRNAHRDYLLKSLLRCGVCRYRYCGNGRVYRCGGAMLHTGAGRVCESAGISVSVLDGSVWKGLKTALADPKVLMDHLDQIVEARRTGVGLGGITKESIESETAKIKAAEGRLLDAYTNGIISRDQLDIQMRKLKVRLEALPPVPEDTPVPVEGREKFFDYCRKLRRGLDVVENDFEKKRNVLRTLVQEVTIDPNRQLIIHGKLSDGQIVTPLRSQRSHNNSSVPFQIQVKLAAA